MKLIDRIFIAVLFIWLVAITIKSFNLTDGVVASDKAVKQLAEAAFELHLTDVELIKAVALLNERGGQ